MNAAEHIVEAYFRHCRKCFTFVDLKVPAGTNRQLDILAYHLASKDQFHIEVGVSHQLNWCYTFDKMRIAFAQKFFGVAKEKKAAAGAPAQQRKKAFFQQINDAYRSVGFDPERVQRIWVCWIVKDQAEGEPKREVQFAGRTYPITVLSLRDEILPELEKAVATANYDDEILRTLGFLKQRSLQQAPGRKCEEKLPVAVG